MQEPRGSNRRQFLATATAGVGAATLGTPAVQARGANDRIAVGLIGVGGRCRHLVGALKDLEGVTIAGICDVYDAHLEFGKALADGRAFATKDFRALLDRDDIDAVLIATPDHWHTPITIAACDAKKDVYVEKPLTHKMEEGPAVIAAQDRNERIVQVGTQQRSMPHFQKAAELIRAGRIGDVHKVRLTWNRNADRMRRPEGSIDPNQVDWKRFLGNAPDQPFDGYKLVGNWRWFWDFGGGLFTDLMVHHIDIVHWILDLDRPKSAASIGDHVSAEGVWETPDTVQTLLSYPGKIQAHFAGTFSNARDGEMIEFMGTDGTLYLDRGRYEIHPERGRGEPEEMILGSGPRGADFYDKPDGERLHLQNWLDCIRSREKPNAPAEAGVSAADAAHLANRALRSGEVARWDG